MSNHWSFFLSNLKQSSPCVDNKPVKHPTSPKTLHLFISLVFGLTITPHVVAQTETNCTYTREFITALEYLRSQQDAQVAEKDARVLAQKISRGCTGAAQRFIKVHAALSKASLGGKASTETGLEFTKRTDADTEGFVAVFLMAYLPDQLDLDLASSIRLARSLSTSAEGAVLPNLATVRDDFQALVRFCTESQEMALPRPECGLFAVRLAKKNAIFSGGIAAPFIQLFRFLASEKGPHLTTGESLKLAERLMEAGTDSADNFIQAYKYSISPRGLAASAQESVEFARQMSFP